METETDSLLTTNNVKIEKGEDNESKPGYHHASKMSVAFNVFGIICYPLSIPYAFGQSGWIACFFGFIFACLSTYFNAHLLGEICIHRPDLNTYPDIAEAAYGVNAARFTNALQWIGFYLLSIYNLVLLGEYMSMMFSSLCQDVWIPIMAAFLVIFLQIPSFEELSWLAMVFFFIVLLSLVMIVEESVVGRYCDVTYNELTLYTVVNGFTAFSFSFGGSGMFPEVISEMKTKSDFIGFNGSLSIAYYALVPIYLLAGVMGFIAFGNDASGNILEDFPSGAVRKVSLILLALMICFNTLESNQLLCKKVERYFKIHPMNWTDGTSSLSSQPGAQRALVRIFMLSTQVFFAEMLYSAGAGDLQSLVGAVAGMPLSFVLPTVYHFKLLPEQYPKGSTSYALLVLAALIGLLLACCGTAVALYNIITGIDDYTLFGGTCTESIDTNHARCEI